MFHNTSRDRHGSRQQGLAVYEKGFQPLWAPELIKSYFDCLRKRTVCEVLDEAKAAQQANPGDLNAAARIFYYYQQARQTDAAQETLPNSVCARTRPDPPGAPRNFMSAQAA